MLHIILLILKIIGIILAIILGILILLIGIVLFVPVRYELSGRCDGDVDSLKMKIKVTWLLHLVRADIFLKGKKLKWKVRVAWLKKTNTAAVSERKSVKRDEKKDEKIQPPEVVSDESEKEIRQKHGEVEEAKEPIEEDNASESTFESSEEKPSFGQKVRTIIEKIKDLITKKEKLADFLTDKSHVNAFKKVKKEVVRLLKKLKPKKIDIKVRFGFEDPSVTGQVLGGISMFYPIFGDSVQLIPDFENQVLKGSAYLKGRIRIWHFVSMAVKLLLCKDIRTSYKDIKNFKL